MKLGKLAKLIKKTLAIPSLMPVGILEWDHVDNKFYIIKSDTLNNLETLYNIEKQKKY